MPFTDKALRREIQKWVGKEGCKVGRITSRMPLALNMHLVEVVWRGIQDMNSRPTLLWVCNTTLEAELLDRQLKDKSFHSGQIGEYSFVSKTGRPVGNFVLLSYARFREFMNQELNDPRLPSSVVVVCEQEPGTNLDAIVARGHFALHARNILSEGAGSNVKLLGLSYRPDGGGDWLQHAVKVMSTAPSTLSLDRAVSYSSASHNAPEHYTYDENFKDEHSLRCAHDAAVVMKNGQHVVLYGRCDHSDMFAEQIEDAPSFAGLDVLIGKQFVDGIKRDPSSLSKGTSHVLMPPEDGEPMSLIVQFRFMGLLRNEGARFVLTGKGVRATRFLEQEASLSLEAATAMAGILDHTSAKVARSILRLSLIKDSFGSMWASSPMESQSQQEFVAFLQSVCTDEVHGGPGRERIDRGLVWLVWVSFESMAYSVCVDEQVLGRIFRSTANHPFYFRKEGVMEAIETLARWEALLNLTPFETDQQADWDTPLSMEEVAIIDQEIAQANYSSLLAIPCRVERPGHAQPAPLPVTLLRSSQPVIIESHRQFDRFLFETRQSLGQNLHDPPSRDYLFWGGLPTEVTSYPNGPTTVMGLMWFPFDVVKSLIGDPDAEDADPWVMV
ncbi:hypothetical protein Daus18300_013818 [Diaporthe australafricana]|uniref:Uncharacterized protein n=1 Tax=Diaporthe australafricana TaxID=127596 RepID=A0ABR3VXN3_9PEZI